jgi:putative effector of murein hydrolase LrgA (UPF0299 family)
VQSAGEAVSRLTHLPLPRPVIGVLLLWALLQLRAARAPVAAAAEPLLQHLSPLFVPVDVGAATGSRRRGPAEHVDLGACATGDAPFPRARGGPP